MRPPRRRIVWTRHAEQRLQAWQETRGIGRDDVEQTLRDPPQVLDGTAGTWIAQSPFGDGLLRVAYVDRGRQRRVLTLYWTSKVEKYWRKDDADPI